MNVVEPVTVPEGAVQDSAGDQVARSESQVGGRGSTRDVGQAVRSLPGSMEPVGAPRPGARHAAGPLGRWAAGPLGRWAAGPLGRWAAGPLGRWAAGIIVDAVSEGIPDIPSAAADEAIPDTPNMANLPKILGANPGAHLFPGSAALNGDVLPGEPFIIQGCHGAPPNATRKAILQQL